MVLLLLSYEKAVGEVIINARIIKVNLICIFFSKVAVFFELQKKELYQMISALRPSSKRAVQRGTRSSKEPVLTTHFPVK